MSDNVNHPTHYNQGEIEVIDAIEDWQLNFNLGNAVKYIARAGHKQDGAKDLKKALWYLCRELMDPSSVKSHKQFDLIQESIELLEQRTRALEDKREAAKTFAEMAAENGADRA